MNSISCRRRRLAACVAATFALTAFAPPCFAAYDNVLNCNDTGAGSLRDTITNAASGDTIVLNPVTMQCSSITLGSGEIVVPQNYLTVKYNGNNANQFTIAGNAHRVFHHLGRGTLELRRLAILEGKYNGPVGGTAAGGCIFSQYGFVDLEYSTVSACRVTSGNTGTSPGSFGGGVAAYGLVLNHSTINTNIVEDPTDAEGGGARAHVADISYSLIRGNTSSGIGGGLSIDDLQLANSTVSGNMATLGAGAMALGNIFYIRNSTIAFNTSGGSAVVAYHYQNLNWLGANNNRSVIYSSILSDNTNSTASPYDLETVGTIYLGGNEYTLDMGVVGSNNIVASASNKTLLPGGTRSDDPLLLPLANNGGPTLTHAFRDGSPAYGNGANPSHFTTDQRGSGFARTVNGATDIGALQQQVRDVIFANGFD